MNFLVVRVTLHRELLPISSLPIWCFNGQIDFQFACAVLIDIPSPPSPLVIQLDILTRDGSPVGGVQLSPVTLTNSRRRSFFLNRREFALRDARNRRRGHIVFSAMLSGQEQRDPRRLLEPDLQFIEISIGSLRREPVADDVPAIEEEDWALDARLSGWVSEADAMMIWQRLARANGWRPPDGVNMVLETAAIDNYIPGAAQVGGGKLPANVMRTDVVFERPPRVFRLSGQMENCLIEPR
jgi:hypothetical protein